MEKRKFDVGFCVDVAARLLILAVLIIQAV